MNYELGATYHDSDCSKEIVQSFQSYSIVIFDVDYRFVPMINNHETGEKQMLPACWCLA